MYVSLEHVTSVIRRSWVRIPLCVALVFLSSFFFQIVLHFVQNNVGIVQFREGRKPKALNMVGQSVKIKFKTLISESDF